MNNPRALAVLGVGALGLTGLVVAAFWPRRRDLGALGNEHLIQQTAKFYTKKYGVSSEDARRLAMSPHRRKIDDDINEWRSKYGYPESDSPLVRHYARDKIRALAGMSTGMLRVIASESRSPEEYAKRAEAWASSEARPPSLRTLVAAYRHKRPKASPTQIRRLIDAARRERMSHTHARWGAYMNEPEGHEDLID